MILVFDVSRWGRFQDADESAYYEYICRRARIEVHYCAEQFENDGSPVSTIVKGVKRAMAGEYSRELSAKVFIGQCRLIELGYRQGGSRGFGLRRMLRDQAGEPKGLLNRGRTEEHSNRPRRSGSRPIRRGGGSAFDVPGMFAEDGKTESAIANLLNGRGVRTDLDRLGDPRHRPSSLDEREIHRE